MLAYELSEPSFEPFDSGISNVETDQVAKIICPKRLHSPLFKPLSNPNQVALEDQNPRAVATPFVATFADHDNSPSASHPHLEIASLPVTQTRLHHQISHVPSPELPPLKPTSSPLLDSHATDGATNGPVIPSQVPDFHPSLRTEPEDGSRASKSYDTFSLRNGKKLVTTASVRRSTRVHRDDYLPLGPRHLELEYHEAWEELRHVTVKAVFDLGYDSKKVRTGRPVLRAVPPTVKDIMQMNIPSVMQARKRVDEADRKLNDALSKGFTWENTPLPKYEVVEDEKGNILHVTLTEDPLASDPRDLRMKQFGKRGCKRKHEEDVQLGPGDQTKRHCNRPDDYATS
jgi:hypothetical protein